MHAWKRPPKTLRWLPYAVAALFAFPLFWLVSCSLKSDAELAANPFRLLPEAPQWTNYHDAMQSMPFGRYLINTLILCLGSVVGTLFSCSLVAYGLSRVSWRGRQTCFVLVIGTMLLPWHVTMVPRFMLMREMGLYNSLWAIIAPTFLGDAFYIFLLRQFFLTIPTSLNDAARVDGLSEWRIYWQIVLPLSRPALATVALFQFIATWNDFSGPLLYLSDPDRFPLAYGLQQFTSAYADQTHLLMAAATLFTIPVVLLFLAAQRTFVEGIATTGGKES